MSNSNDARWLRRLASHYEPRCWTGIVVRAIPASRIETHDAVLDTPDHFLAAAWAPASTGPSRWPEVVVIGSPASGNALAELFAKLPADASVFLAGRDEVDLVLAATILRESDRNLEPYQREALDAFVAAEVRREREAMALRYPDRDADYERFRSQVITRGDA